MSKFERMYGPKPSYIEKLPAKYRERIVEIERDDNNAFCGGARWFLHGSATWCFSIDKSGEVHSVGTAHDWAEAMEMVRSMVRR